MEWSNEAITLRKSGMNLSRGLNFNWNVYAAFVTNAPGKQTVEGNTCYSSGVKTGFKGLMVTCGGRLGPLICS